MLQLIVRDTGIGVKQEDREKIFEMLGTLEATATMNTQGVGLGLSTCKKIAEAIHGDLFLVDNEYLDQLSLMNSDGSSTRVQIGQEGTAIALVIPCPEVANLYISRRYPLSDDLPQYESNEDSYQSLIEKSNENIRTDSNKNGLEDSQREPFCDQFLNQNLPTINASNVKIRQQKRKKFN